MHGYTKVWVVGAGAVGSVIAALATECGVIETKLVGSSVHWRKVGNEGLSYERPDRTEKKIHIDTISPESIPSLDEHDLVLLTGKLTDLVKHCSILAKKVTPDTGIIALQNGLEVDKWAGELLHRTVDRGLLLFGANCTEAGKVRYHRGRILLRRSHVTEALEWVLNESDLPCELIDDFRPVEWRKFSVNCLANPLAGLLKITGGQATSPILDPIKEGVVTELNQVARAEGVGFQYSVKEFNEYLTKSVNYPSLKADLERGRPTEIDMLNGVVVRLGQKHNIPTPVNQAVVSLIKYLNAQGRK